MTDQQDLPVEEPKKPTKSVKMVEVYTRRAIFLEENVKTPRGKVVKMTQQDYEHFQEQGCVTKDIPKGSERA